MMSYRCTRVLFRSGVGRVITSTRPVARGREEGTGEVEDGPLDEARRGTGQQDILVRSIAPSMVMTTTRATGIYTREVCRCSWGLAGGLREVIAGVEVV